MAPLAVSVAPPPIEIVIAEGLIEIVGNEFTVTVTAVV